MSASLVGSEMCIRDRLKPNLPRNTNDLKHAIHEPPRVGLASGSRVRARSGSGDRSGLDSPSIRTGSRPLSGTSKGEQSARAGGPEFCGCLLYTSDAADDM
eukprot:14241195-Alexandrium_andersonii.AAC.1